MKAEFNYVVSPEVSTKICYKYGRVRVQNCCGIYNQWKDNKVHLKTTYQTRQVCWGVCLYIIYVLLQLFIASFFARHAGQRRRLGNKGLIHGKSEEPEKLLCGRNVINVFAVSEQDREDK